MHSSLGSANDVVRHSAHVPAFKHAVVGSCKEEENG